MLQSNSMTTLVCSYLLNSNLKHENYTNLPHKKTKSKTKNNTEMGTDETLPNS